MDEMGGGMESGMGTSSVETSAPSAEVDTSPASSMESVEPLEVDPSAGTELPAGSRIGRGDRFATVAGGSDHCGESCVHWGVRAGDERYLDPVGQTEARKIVLKPVTET